MMIEKIVSGGQTGVDRAALDVALGLEMPYGGWCPRGRLAEDGPIEARYKLRETESADYLDRTRLNVRDSDGTLIVCRGAPEGGTKDTVAFAAELGRPCHIVDLDRGGEVAPVLAWIEANGVRVLNVAGPRASKQAHIHADAGAFLRRLLTRAIRARS